MRANRRLLNYVKNYIAWTEEVWALEELKTMLKARSKEEIIERFCQAEDVLPLVQEFARAIGHLQAKHRVPFAYGLADPPDLCGRRIECRPMAE